MSGAGWRLAAVVLAAGLLIAGCNSTQVTTASGGTPLQARDVVRLVYGQSGEPGSANLPYWAGDIVPAIKRMMARFPELRRELGAGTVGLTSDGLLAMRPSAQAGDAALALIRRENMDRDILYSASAVEAGHGVANVSGDWMPVERAAFAREWAVQAPAGWWLRSEKGEWLRKVDDPVPAGAASK